MPSVRSGTRHQALRRRLAHPVTVHRRRDQLLSPLLPDRPRRLPLRHREQTGGELTVTDPTRARDPHPGGNGTRPVPHDLEAERALLGVALFWPAAVAACATVPPGAYYHPRHQNIAQAIAADYLATGGTSAVSTRARLTDPEDHALVSDLVADAADANASHAHRYADIITSCARRRGELHIALELADAARNGTPTAQFIARLADQQAATGADELALEDLDAALDAPDDEDRPTVLARSDGGHLLYPEAVNCIQSEPSLGKSWLALAAAAEHVTTGHHVLYLDHEDVPRRVARRLLTVGLDRQAITERFHYLRPGPLTPTGLAGLPRLAERLHATFVVIDGVAAAMAAQALDENDASDFYTWSAAVPEPLANTGACVLLLDHVAKAKENRGRYSRGSGSKLAAITGACYTLESLEPLSRNRPAKLKLTVAKDRHAHVGAVGDIAAIVTFTPTNGGDDLAWQAEQPNTSGHGEWQGPTECMDVLRRFFTEIAPTSAIGKSAMRPRLKAAFGSSFGNNTIYEALERLVLDGTLVATEGPRNGRYYRLNPNVDPDPELPLDTPDWEPF